MKTRQSKAIRNLMKSNASLYKETCVLTGEKNQLLTEVERLSKVVDEYEKIAISALKFIVREDQRDLHPY